MHPNLLWLRVVALTTTITIMGTQDRNLRRQAIPYIGQIMTYNRSEQSDQDVSSAQTLGDIRQFLYNPNGQKDFIVRILRPQFGQIIQAYLNISLTFDSTETSPKFYVSAGSGYAADGITAVVPPSSYILQTHQQITGQAAPLTGVAGQPLTAYKLNILPLIPQIGSSNYSIDSYVVGMHFLQTPVMTGLFHLQKFFITGSALVKP